MIWTKSEDRLIRDNWRTMSDLQLSDLLPGRAVTAIHQHRAIDLRINRRDPPPLQYPDTNYTPARNGLKIYHGTLPDNPITEDDRKRVELRKRVYGTYNDGRRIKCT